MRESVMVPPMSVQSDGVVRMLLGEIGVEGGRVMRPSRTLDLRDVCAVLDQGDDLLVLADRLVRAAGHEAEGRIPQSVESGHLDGDQLLEARIRAWRDERCMELL